MVCNGKNDRNLLKLINTYVLQYCLHASSISYFYEILNPKILYSIMTIMYYG